jgi:hypothetical protein
MRAPLASAQRIEHVQTVHARHTYIEEHDVDRRSLQFRKHFLTIAGFRDNHHVVRDFQQPAKPS